jgi:hypothetical protein
LQVDARDGGAHRGEEAGHVNELDQVIHDALLA